LHESVLVAGGAGYIGSHTAKLLRQRGSEPVVLDNLATGHRHAAIFGPFYEGAIEDQDLVRRIVREHKISAVVVFAGHAYVGESVLDPWKYYRNNVVNVLHFLHTLMESGVRHVVCSSSCAIFGQKTEIPIVEDSPTDPLSPYAESKLVIERALGWFGNAGSLRYVNLRYFNAAGADPEGQLGECHNPETHLIPLAISAANGGPALRVFGTDYPTPDGTAVRDYVHVCDLADAHLRAIDYLADGNPSTSINLGTGAGTSVMEIIKTVERECGSRVAYSTGPRRAGDAPILVANPAKARTLLGWQPRYPEVSGIVRSAWNWHSRKRAAGE
jgi:UDP-glucose-4-epimerase GalE